MDSITRIVILQMNDSHAYFEPHHEVLFSDGRTVYRRAGGYAKIASVLDAARAEYPGRVIALDCGDTLHGTYPAVATKGYAVVPILNRLGFTAMTAHWEFAYGPAHLKELARSLAYPILAINCYEEKTGELFFEPYVVKELGGVRIGIIGIASAIVDKTMPRSFSKGLQFTLGNRELPSYIKMMRDDEKADVVVVISHLGLPQDVKLANEVSGVDVILSGHTHDRLHAPIFSNGTLIMQSGSMGSFIGKLVLELDGGKIVGSKHELITINERIAPEMGTQELVRRALAPFRTTLDTAVGRIRQCLNRCGMLESSMDYLLLESIMDSTNAQLAFSNGWRFGAPIARGEICMNDLYNIIPMDSPVSTVELSGSELREMIEENIEHTFSPDPYCQMGGFLKRCLGMRAYVRLQNPCGSRLKAIFVNGMNVNDGERYFASFVTEQAVPLKFGRNRRKLRLGAVESMIAYLRKKGDYAPRRHDAFVIV